MERGEGAASRLKKRKPRRALTRNEFSIIHQPIFSLPDRRIIEVQESAAAFDGMSSCMVVSLAAYPFDRSR
jgi:hypothetical protein